MVQELTPWQRESELRMYQGRYTVSTGGREEAMNFCFRIRYKGSGVSAQKKPKVQILV